MASGGRLPRPSAGPATVSRPTPAESAPRAASAAAPGIRREPATSSRRPSWPLWTPAARPGRSRATRAESFVQSPSAPAESRTRGMPISATRTRPQAALAGDTKWQIFGAASATVRSARKKSSGTRPLSAARPLGMSTATRRAPQNSGRRSRSRDHPGRQPAERPGTAGAQDRVHQHPRARSGDAVRAGVPEDFFPCLLVADGKHIEREAGRGLEVVPRRAPQPFGRGQQDGGGRRPCAARQRSGHQSVPAVASRTAQQQGPAGRRRRALRRRPLRPPPARRFPSAPVPECRCPRWSGGRPPASARRSAHPCPEL